MSELITDGAEQRRRRFLRNVITLNTMLAVFAGLASIISTILWSTLVIAGGTVSLWEAALTMGLVVASAWLASNAAEALLDALT